MSASMIKITTTAYEFSHGRSPKGFGIWAFAADVRTSDASDIIWTPAMMSYANAKKYAQKVAAERGLASLVVLP